MPTNEYEVRTPFGLVVVSPTGKDHLHVASRPCDPLYVNRVYYYISLHLYHTERGFEVRPEELYASVHGLPNKDITPAASKRVLAEIPPLVDNWTRSPEGRAALERAEKVRLEQESKKLRESIEQTEAQLAELREEYAGVQAKLGVFLCACCKKNSVDTAGGFDTCPECLAKR